MQKKKKTANLSYDDVADIIEELVSAKAYQATFDCWDVDDVGQEIRIICFNSLKTFDATRAPTRDKIKNYLGKCVDTRLLNLKRDKYIRFNPPFSKKKVAELESNPDSDPEAFEKLQKFKEDLEKKKAIKNTVNLGTSSELWDYEYNSHYSHVEAKDIKEYIMENIDEEYVSALEKILGSKKNKVDFETKKRVQESVKDILDK